MAFPMIKDIYKDKRIYTKILRCILNITFKFNSRIKSEFYACSDFKMNKTKHLLTCLIDECAEIQNAIAKTLRFGLDYHAPHSHSANIEDLATETINLVAVARMIKEENIFPIFN